MKSTKTLIATIASFTLLATTSVALAATPHSATSPTGPTHPMMQDHGGMSHSMGPMSGSRMMQGHTGMGPSMGPMSGGNMMPMMSMMREMNQMMATCNQMMQSHMMGSGMGMMGSGMGMMRGSMNHRGRNEPGTQMMNPTTRYPMMQDRTEPPQGDQNPSAQE